MITHTPHKIAPGLISMYRLDRSLGLARKWIFASLLLVAGCCSHPDYVALGTFDTLDGGFSRIQDKFESGAAVIVRLDESDPKHGAKNAEINERERQSTIDICKENRALCVESAGGNR